MAVRDKALLLWVGVPAAVGALVIAGPAEARHPEQASRGQEIYSGEYAGTTFVAARGLRGETADGSVVSDVDFDGTWSLEVADDLTSTGRFTLGGGWQMEITAGGSTGTAIGTTTGSGTIDGAGPKLTTTAQETNNFTVELGGFSRSFSNTDAMPSADFTVVVANCSELTGTWERAWEGVAGEAGYSNPQVVTGEFVGIRTSFEDDKARIDEFFETWNANTPEQNADIDVSGLPSVLGELRDYQKRLNDLQPFVANDAIIDDWFTLIDDAANLSERVRNADPCELGGRDDLQQGPWTLPSQVVDSLLSKMSGSVGDAWPNSDAMLRLAIKAMEYHVAGPNAARSDAAERATGTFAEWLDSAASFEEVMDVTEPGREIAVDGLIVAKFLGLEPPQRLVDLAATDVYTAENGDTMIDLGGETLYDTITDQEGVTTSEDGS